MTGFSIGPPKRCSPSFHRVNRQPPRQLLQPNAFAFSCTGFPQRGHTASATGCATEPEELPEIDFHLTRPFLFAIESYDGTVLFIGTITAPVIEE